MKLDLLKFFQLIENESYVIIKPSTLLPDYEIGSDIDIFCYQPSQLIEKVTSFLALYVDSNSTVNVNDGAEKAHVDYLVDGKIHFRFDLYKQLPTYKNIHLKPAFFSSVIESSQARELTEKEPSVIVKVPSEVDDLILRYVEYHEYYALRPDKIKHIEYIQNKISDDKNELTQMLDKLHYYTAFPQVEYREKTFKERLIEKRDYYQSNIDKVKHLYVTAGLRPLIRKIIKKIRK